MAKSAEQNTANKFLSKKYDDSTAYYETQKQDLVQNAEMKHLDSLDEQIATAKEALNMTNGEDTCLGAATLADILKNEDMDYTPDGYNEL